MINEQAKGNHGKKTTTKKKTDLKGNLSSATPRCSSKAHTAFCLLKPHLAVVKNTQIFFFYSQKPML